MTPISSALLEQTRQNILSSEGDLIALRRHLHAHPELSREEFETTNLLAARLEGLGFEVHIR